MDSDQKSKTERKIAIDLENKLILLNRYVELLPGMKYMIVDTAKFSTAFLTRFPTTKKYHLHKITRFPKKTDIRKVEINYQ